MSATRRFESGYRHWPLLLAVGLMWAVFVLAGCGTGTTPSELYLQRLAGALNVDLANSSSRSAAGTALIGFPATSELAIDRAEEKIGVADYLELHRCELGGLIGGRNGSLGRLQGYSQRWLYDAALVRGMAGCAELSDALRAVQHSRTASLGAAAFNALFAGPEWRAFVTPPVIAGAAIEDPAGLERALGSLLIRVADPVAVGDGDSPLDLEQTLAMLRFSQALGVARASWQQQTAWLNRAASLLESAATANPGCLTGKPTETGRIRANVFDRYYVQALQPQLAEQARPDRGWLGIVRQLVRATAAASGPGVEARRLLDWHQAVLGAEGEFGAWESAMQRHTAAWQQQLTRCGLMPAR